MAGLRCRGMVSPEGKETKGWAFGAASNPYPLTLALALLPVCLEALTLPMQLLVPCWGMGLLGSLQRPFLEAGQVYIIGTAAVRNLWPLQLNQSMRRIQHGEDLQLF